MSVNVTITTNARGVAAEVDKLDASMSAGTQQLLLQIGQKITEDTKNRIRSQDSGRWAAASKWTQAKTGQERVLLGIEKYLQMKATATTLQVYADTDGEWTFTQHDQGFENKQDHFDGEKIEIEIEDPGPLGLSALPGGVFAWSPKNGAGRTPARKIWPTDEEVNAMVQPIASRWLQAQIAALNLTPTGDTL